MLKSCGMGSKLASFNNPEWETNSYVYDSWDDINQEAIQWISEAQNMAEDILLQQKHLLLKMSDYLSDNRTMPKEMTKEFLRKYTVDYHEKELIENGDFLFYRKHLKDQIEQLVETSIGAYPLKLNRG
jgi:predicted HicB family RNase H-like nuclease